MEHCDPKQCRPTIASEMLSRAAFDEALRYERLAEGQRLIGDAVGYHALLRYADECLAAAVYHEQERDNP